MSRICPIWNDRRLTVPNPCQDKCLDDYLAEVKEHWRRFLDGQIDGPTRDALLEQSKLKFLACVAECSGS